MPSLLRFRGCHLASRVFDFDVARCFAKATSSAKTDDTYSSELKFASLADWSPIPVFRTLGDDGESLTRSLEGAFAKDRAVDIYRTMLRLHITDGVFYEAQRQGRLSFYLTSFGEEAATVASAAALDSADEAFLQYREHGFLMWRGFTVRQMADQCFGNVLECGKGRQMPIHYGTPDLHVHTISSVLATQIPHAVGAAFALKAEAKPQVTVTFFGDGAASEGDFHAALNFAATLELPVLFVCRNNGYAINLGYCVGIRGPGYGIRTIRVDGGDARAVYLAIQKAREEALKHNCPILIEAMCYRAGHHSTSDDSTRYRSDRETSMWNAKEPIGRFFQFLTSSGWWTEEQNSQLRAEFRQEAIDALSTAEKVSKPSVGELFTDVYAEVPWHLEEQHQDLLSLLEAHPELCPSNMPIE